MSSIQPSVSSVKVEIEKRDAVTDSYLKKGSHPILLGWFGCLEAIIVCTLCIGCINLGCVYPRNNKCYY